MSIILDGTNGINTPNNFAFKNLLINAGFTINQRAYVSAAALATTVYAHDRWKAGAAGGNYSFTQLNSVTEITIATGKTLIQVVEDKNVNGTSFVLSWTGTAQARYAVNSATPAGSYAASPIVITGQTAGTTMSVEFNNGTLSKPQLELGAVPTSFDQRAYGTELALCQRYCWRGLGMASYYWTPYTAGAAFGFYTAFPVSMRAIPILAQNTPSASTVNATTATADYPTVNGFRYIVIGTAAGACSIIFNTTTDSFTATAEL
jgi:hypothetical protein